MTPKPRIKRTAAALLLAFAVTTGAALGVTASPAGAHAVCEKPSPGAGTTVSQTPSTVSCEFAEALAATSTFKVYDACNIRVDNNALAIVGRRMMVGLTSAEPGSYRTVWSAISADDGHRASGTFTFTVQRAVACLATQRPGSAVAPVAAGSLFPGSYDDAPAIDEHAQHGPAPAPAATANRTSPRSTGPVAFALLAIFGVGLVPALAGRRPRDNRGVTDEGVKTG